MCCGIKEKIKFDCPNHQAGLILSKFNDVFISRPVFILLKR